MANKNGAFGFFSSIILLVLAGCRSAERLPYQGDPLLALKKPVTESPKVDERSVLLVYAEPKPPDLPQAALLADSKTKHAEKASAFAQKDPSPSETAEPGAVGSVLKAKARLDVFLTSRRKVPGIHGHAGDYSWLQGVLEGQAPGGMQLVYCKPGEADAWGGRVRLQNDDRLATFSAGDVILIEGEMLRDQPAVAVKPPPTPPSYLIHQVWLVRQHD